jgi:hypothetical protein
MIATVALESDFTASCTPNALLAAAVGTNLWHGDLGNPNEEWAVCKEKTGKD